MGQGHPNRYRYTGRTPIGGRDRHGAGICRDYGLVYRLQCYRRGLDPCRPITIDVGLDIGADPVFRIHA